ncbi:TnsA endonuclease N-terminal domain-containing protein [Ferrovibrio terrae]|uniref:TnsA endonuclease N-terminal domain-containing protein n=1 Tax=Ferrovibrio terrae TaxID=2594003 RepID=UPI0031380EEC
MSNGRSRKQGLRGRNLAPIFIGNSTTTLPISRKVVTYRTKRVVGYFQSGKMQCALPWESQIERDYFYCLEFDPYVATFIAQPTCFNLLVDGQPRKHFPDLLVQYVDGSRAFHEVKPDRDALAQEKQPLYEAARRHCAIIETSYHVIAESHIRQQPRLRNCQTLLHYRRRLVSLDDELAIVSALFAGPVAFETLRHVLDEKPDVDAVILCLAATGKICFPLDTELTGQTAFHLARNQ